MVTWQWSKFNELSVSDLYEIIKAREAVFVVEQNCPYQDADGKDSNAWHLVGWDEADNKKELVAYLRVLPPGTSFDEPSIGRIITTLKVRGKGLGKEIMEKAIQKVKELFPNQPIRMSAQEHLETYYEKFGFKKNSGVYDEDGIPHIDMVLKG